MRSLVYFFVVVLLVMNSCKKEESKTNRSEICITVKDISTQQPVENAAVSVGLDQDLTAQSGGSVVYGSTDAAGSVCLENAGGPYVSGCSVNIAGYEPYCFVFNPSALIYSFEVLLLKRNSFIKFHLRNQPPVYTNDSLRMLMNYLNNFCSGAGELIVHDSTVTDTVIYYPVINGENGISWNLYRNNILVSDSHFTVNVSQGDTMLLQIEY